MRPDTTLRDVIAAVFEEFIAHPLGAASDISTKDPGVDPDDADTVEKEFRGRTWHDLIYFHYRWDRALLLRWALTDEAYLEALPSYLCASLIWPEVEALKIAADLLAPIDKRFGPDWKEWKIRRFRYAREGLGGRAKTVVRNFLIYSLESDSEEFEFYFSASNHLIRMAIDEYWSGDAERSGPTGSAS